MAKVKKYEYAVPHQQDVPNDRQRKAFRDINEQFKEIGTDVSNLSKQVESLQPTAQQQQATIAPVSPSLQPVAQPAGMPDISATFVTVAAEASLPSSRQLAAGAGISLTDGGAGSTITVSATSTTAVLFTRQTSSATPVTIATGNVEFRGSSTAGADQIANLPAATGSGFIKIAKKMDANAHSVVVTANGGDLIDGVATFTVGPTQYAAVWIIDAAAGVWDVLVVK